MTNNERGQALVETLSSLSLTVLALLAILIVLAFAFSKYRLDFYLHEALVCSISRDGVHSQGSTQSRCEANLQRALGTFNQWFKIREIRWHSKVDEIGISVHTDGWRWQKIEIGQFKFHKALQLPLRLP